MFDVKNVISFFLSLFSGIITAYIVYVLTDIDISEVFFVVFVVFCAFLNIIVYRSIVCALTLLYLMHVRIRISALDRASPELARLRSTSSELWARIRKNINIDADAFVAQASIPRFIAYVFIGAATGLILARAYQGDFILSQAARVYDWPKEHDRNPLEQFSWSNCNRTGQHCPYIEVRDPDGSLHKEIKFEYMKVWWKDSKLITAGYIHNLPKRKTRPIVELSKSCVMMVNENMIDETMYVPHVKDIFTSFIDLLNPNILFIEVYSGSDPCDPQDRNSAVKAVSPAR